MLDDADRPTALAPGAGDDLERDLARLWAELLRRDSVDPHDNFFRIGGNSLLVMLVIAHVNKRYGVAVPAQDVFDSPTVAALARAVRATRRAEA